ncbi:hypothetical protein TI05_06880, partial [Achromatium sp. WMS3]
MKYNKYKLITLIPLVLLTPPWLRSSHSATNISTDGTVGSGSVQSCTGSCTIPQSWGTTKGNNLFHSFSTFNVGSGHTATFTGANTLQNVFSRVTGGTTSTINGTIDSTGIPGANFFLINPAGVVFGAGAQVNVGGDFHVSTANTLNFSDGTKFEAGSTATTNLTAADPSAFGFATNPTGAIKIENGNLTFSNGGTVSFSGDSITSSSSVNLNNGTSLRVYGRGTTANVVVPLTGDLPAGNGEINVSDGRWRAMNGGSIQISGGAIQIGGSAGGEVLAETDSSSNAGSVTIKAESLIVGDEGIFSAGVDGSTGDVGGITLNVSGELQVKNGAEISAYSFGNVGAVTINAGSLIVDRGSSTEDTRIITGIRGTPTDGTSGNLNINVNGAMEVLNGGFVGSITQSSSNAGNVTITAGSLTIDGREKSSSSFYSGIYSLVYPSSTGSSGDIMINIDGDMKIFTNGKVRNGPSTDSNDQGDTGTITITAGNLILDGTGMASESDKPSIASGVTNDSTLNAGNINITVTDDIQVLSGSKIFSYSKEGGTTGVVDITAKNLIIDGQGSQYDTGISSVSEGTAGGNAGNVNINVTGAMQILDGGRIASDTFTQNDTGSITITAGSLTITSAEITASTNSSGQAGDVIVNISGAMQILNGGDVGSISFGQGNAGAVSVTADSLEITNGGIWSAAEPGSTGRGNTVDVNVTGLLQMSNNGYIETHTSGPGDAGSITVSAGSLSMDGSAIASANDTSGAAGNAGDVTVNVTGDATITGTHSELASGHGVNLAIGTFTKGSG